jgi:hypothetical protein
MKKSFLVGAVSGIVAISVALPVIAQFASAQSSSASSTSATATDFMMKHGPRTPLTQAKVQEMADRDAAFLQNIDAMTAALKTAVEARKTALTAAASITDETARNDAVEKAHDDFRTAMEAFIAAHPDIKGAMMPFGGPGGPHHGGPFMKGMGGMRGHHMMDNDDDDAGSSSSAQQ